MQECTVRLDGRKYRIIGQPSIAADLNPVVYIRTKTGRGGVTWAWQRLVPGDKVMRVRAAALRLLARAQPC